MTITDHISVDDEVVVLNGKTSADVFRGVDGGNLAKYKVKSAIHRFGRSKRNEVVEKGRRSVDVALLVDANDDLTVDSDCSRLVIIYVTTIRAWDEPKNGR